MALLVLLDVGPGVAATAGDPDIAANRLPEALVQALRHYRIPINSVSVFAQEIGHEPPIVSVASDVARNPASVIKLLPTLVALEELGPAYTWKTEAYATAAVEKRKLAGDLYLKGYGDPYFLTEHFWRLLRGLRIGGITGIDGDLVLDRSFFEPDMVDPADFDGQPYRVYNTSASALLLNFHAINFRIEPDTDARRVRIVADPRPDQVKIDNRVELINGPCRYWNSRPKMRVIHTPHADTVHFSGRYAAGCGQRPLFRSISEPAPYVYGVFKNLWREQGGHFAGQLRERFAETYDPPGTLTKGVQAVHAWLQKKGLHFPELVLDNGTGLSREVRISARHLAKLLFTAYRSPTMPEFVSSLPIAGVDGTLHKRFANSDFAGRLHVKTGTLDNVRALAGYLLDARGRRLVVVYLHNHRSAHLRAGARAEAVFLRWLYNRP
jgi:D-alanyl-D-alanine carboxypeptidase/D-alanyl-D-alanine-endopeptidase (penicillin-binding protein 4)